MITDITPSELAALLRDEAPTLIDVRTPAEFNEAHVVGARNHPLDQIGAKDVTDLSTPLMVICHKGGRSKMACEKLAADGVGDLHNVTGGTLACIAAGLPIKHGKKAISLERQVRIAAGSLVVIGVALGVFVHPAALGLAAFVGAGLVFAGVTDTCGMGMLLARMPWNQAPAEANNPADPAFADRKATTNGTE